KLVARIERRVSWDSGVGRPRQLSIRQATKATIMYFKTNVTEEVIGGLHSGKHKPRGYRDPADCVVIWHESGTTGRCEDPPRFDPGKKNRS
ncbi:MAG TPA: hypothetical protein VNP03_00080, partial [Pseudonocardia sp.]|nr:hypothetical protein [Pseudonocardia sp.]